MKTLTEPAKRRSSRFLSLLKKSDYIFHNICKKPKKLRTSKDNFYLYQNCKNLHCFKKIINMNNNGDLMYKSVIQNLDFVFYEPEKIIYSPKELITNVFFIFQGSVAVYKETKSELINLFNKNNNKFQERNTNFNSTKPMNTSGSSGRKKAIKRSQTKSINKTFGVMRFYSSNTINKNKDILKLKKKIITNDNEEDEINYIISAGEDYGINDIKSVRRVELVKTKTKCIIGFLSKQDYKYIFEKTKILEKLDAVNFLKGLKIFKDIKCDIILENLLHAAKKKYYKKGDYLAKIGDDFKSFYIVKKGGFEIYLNLKKKIRNIFNDINDFGNFTLKEKSENIKYQIKNYYIDDMEYKIVTHGQGEVIGDIEYYLNSDKFLSNIVSSTENSEVYEISREDFFTFTPKSVKQLVANEGEMKRDYYRQRVKDIDDVNSKIMSKKKNQFRVIISKKLEEEKGEIFKRMETKDYINKLKVKFKEINKLNLCKKSKSNLTCISVNKPKMKHSFFNYFKNGFKNYFNNKPISKQIINKNENYFKMKNNFKDNNDNNSIIGVCNTNFNKTRNLFHKGSENSDKILDNENCDNNDNNFDDKVNHHQKNNFRFSGKIPDRKNKSKKTTSHKRLYKMNMEFQQIYTNLYTNQDIEFCQRKKSESQAYYENTFIGKYCKNSYNSKNKNKKIFISSIDDINPKKFCSKVIFSFDEIKKDEKFSIESKLSCNYRRLKMIKSKTKSSDFDKRFFTYKKANNAN